jgi:predicted ester cyclase
MGMPATGKTVDIEFWHIDRIANGKIVERWNVMDNMAFMQQLGAMPTMPAK